jgi:hypothetical protein
MRLALLLLCAAAALPAAEPLRGPTNSLVSRPFGVLLLGEGGDREWRAAVEDVVKKAAKRYPVEFAAGLGDSASMQRALDSLQAQRVKSIVVVPLCVSSYGDTMDQVRYLLGIREHPSEAFLGPHARPSVRVRSRVPLVLTKALDDHPLFIELLTARAQALSRHPEQEAVILAGDAPMGTPGDKDRVAETEWLQAAQAVADKVRQKGRFAAAQAFALRSGPTTKERRQSTDALRALVKEHRRERKVIVVQMTMTGGALRLNRVLDGLFAKYDGRAVLPDARIAQWVEQSAMPAAKLPDMRLFKDPARAGLTPLGFAKPPPLPRPGEKQ